MAEIPVVSWEDLLKHPPQGRVAIGERERVNAQKYRQRLQDHPGWYFYSVEEVDGASIYLNLLKTCLEEGCFLKARRITFSIVVFC
jgi:hypothetical protein